MATSYNGWPASKDPNAIGVNRNWEPLPGVKFPGGVKSGDVEVVMTELVLLLNEYVEPADPNNETSDDEWGYTFKMSANSADLISCHASATAIDYNARKHPNRKRGTWEPWQYDAIGKILNHLDGVIRWLALKADGGSAAKTPDEMHFEIRGDAAAVKAVADKIRSKNDNPQPSPEEDDMELINPRDGQDAGNWFLRVGNKTRMFQDADVEELQDLKDQGIKIIKPGAGTWDFIQSLAPRVS